VLEALFNAASSSASSALLTFTKSIYSIIFSRTEAVGGGRPAEMAYYICCCKGMSLSKPITTDLFDMVSMFIQRSSELPVINTASASLYLAPIAARLRASW
jgi:hypothetical protein